MQDDRDYLNRDNVDDAYRDWKEGLCDAEKEDAYMDLRSTGAKMNIAYLLLAIFELVGAVSFGFWRHHWAAGVWMACTLLLLTQMYIGIKPYKEEKWRP